MTCSQPGIMDLFKCWSVWVQWLISSNFPSLHRYTLFHVSLLKKAVGNHNVEETLLQVQGMEGESSEVSEPAAVLATKRVSKKGETVSQMLIHWKGKLTEEATWEEEFTIQSQFPKFSLKDKAGIEEGGNVRAQNKPTGLNEH